MPVRFVRDFTVVDRPYEDVALVLTENAGTWLSPLADTAYREGEALRVRVGPGERASISKDFELRVGPASDTGDGLLLVTSWQATGTPGLFPTMDADIRISPLGADRTHLSLDGRYTPPLGLVGEHVDDLLLHRIAESSIRSFLQRVVRTLEERIPEIDPTNET
jgi:hypothetical protein